MPRKSMRSRRSRRGGDWMSPSTWFGSKKPDDTGYGSTGYGSTGSTGYGSTGSTGYGSTGYGSTGSTGYGSTGSTGYGSTGSTGYGSTGSTGYGSTGSTGYGSTGSTGYGSTGSTGYPPPTSSGSYGYGGKKGKRRRSMRGGDYSDNISLNNLAANAAPFSNGNTATAPYVGGRTRRRRHRHRHTKSCKKSCRKH